MTKQSIFVEYIEFEFCWNSLADEHNTDFSKSTRRNVKLNKFDFGTKGLYQIFNVQTLTYV